MGHPWSPRAHLDLMRWVGTKDRGHPTGGFPLSAPAFPLIPPPFPFLRISFPLTALNNDTCGLLDTKRLIQFSPPGLAFEKLLRKREGRKRRLAEDQSDVKKKSLPSSCEGSPLAVLGDLCIDKLLQGRGRNLYHERFRSRVNERGLSGLTSFSF